MHICFIMDNPETQLVPEFAGLFEQHTQCDSYSFPVMMKSRYSRRGDLDKHMLSASIARSSLYEAALLFKIATRRVNRLNSPRPQEFLAMFDEVARCLSTKEES